MEFTNVIYKPLNGPLAQVDRTTGELFIDSNKWPLLASLPDGKLYQDYVLLHENGHLYLNTADEYQANNYAIEKFFQVGQLTNDELGRRIIVLSDLMDEDQTTFKDKNKPGIEPVSIITAAIAAISAIFGAASKNNAANKQNQTLIQVTNIQKKQAEDQAKATQQIVIVGGFILFFIVITIVAFRK